MAGRDVSAGAENCPEESPEGYPQDVARYFDKVADLLDRKASLALALSQDQFGLNAGDARRLAETMRETSIALTTTHLTREGFRELARDERRRANLAAARADRAEARELAASTGIMRAALLTAIAHILLDIAGLI
jgi:hypothetical protein